jgi:hypothetical protein
VLESAIAPRESIQIADRTIGGSKLADPTIGDLSDAIRPSPDRRWPMTQSPIERLPITDYRLPITDCRLPIADRAIADCRSPIRRSPITDRRFDRRSPIADRR